MLKSEDINYDLSARVLSGEATSSEFALHEQWLAADPLHQEEWNEMVQAWNAASDAIRFQEIDVDGAWNQVKDQIKPKVKQVWYKQSVYQRVAASAIILLAAVSVIWLLKPTEKIEYKEILIYSEAGEDILLPDSSTVWLSAKSSLAYTAPFASDRRSIKFSGEAFFQVEGDANWPFIIETDDITIKVTGTAFNVRSRPEQLKSFVDVSNGIVEVSAKSDLLNSIQLTAGLRAIYDRKNGNLEKNIADRNFLAWKTQQIEFQNTSLDQVFETLENVYQVKIRVSDASILEERMGGTFSQNTLDFITEVVCTTFDLEVSKDQNVLYFSRSEH
jgi:ferric-dicitrate binding protein FerR (iron transport regulator)